MRFFSEETTLILLMSILRISARALTIMTSFVKTVKQFRLNLMALLKAAVLILITVTFSLSPNGSNALTYSKYSV